MGNGPLNRSMKTICTTDLPADAWTGFLMNRTDDVSTRTNVFPFDIEDAEKDTDGRCLFNLS